MGKSRPSPPAHQVDENWRGIHCKYDGTTTGHLYLGLLMADLLHTETEVSIDKWAFNLSNYNSKSCLARAIFADGNNVIDFAAIL